VTGERLYGARQIYANQRLYVKVEVMKLSWNSSTAIYVGAVKTFWLGWGAGKVAMR
jgi:hypothetical protein